MDDEQFAFLSRLAEVTGPSGYEQPAQCLWRERIKQAASSINTDRLGNAVAIVNPLGKPRVLLDAHIDEIGFIIRYIDDNGYLYFSTIGGFDASTLVGNRACIMGRNGPVIGVFGRKPIHLLDQDERKKAPEIKNMWIDIGVGSKGEAEDVVRVGDAGGRAYPLQRLQGNVVTASAMDDRIGSYIVAETVRNVAQEQLRSCLVAASTVQEEIGLRGARVAAYASDADIGIAVDVTPPSDHPQSSKTQIGDIRVGGGPVLTRGANTNPRVFDLLIDAAEAAGVPYQIEAIPGRTPTDEDVMQLTREGMATGLVSVPARYLHTASEVLSLDDVDATVALLVRFLRDLDPNVNLIP